MKRLLIIVVLLALLTIPVACDHETDWSQAINHVGEQLTICGPVVSTNYATASNGSPTFMNIGKPYPDSNRFIVLIWGNNRHNFLFEPESYYLGKNICVTGVITKYDGVAQIEVSSPSQIKVR